MCIRDSYSGVHDPPWQIIGEVYGQLVQNSHTSLRFNRPLLPDAPRPQFNGGTTGLNEQGLGSPHPGTVTTVLGDGSAHNFSMDLQWEILWDVSMRADGRTVDHNNF